MILKSFGPTRLKSTLTEYDPYERFTLCSYYERCLSYAGKRGWTSFTCKQCSAWRNECPGTSSKSEKTSCCATRLRKKGSSSGNHLSLSNPNSTENDVERSGTPREEVTLSSVLRLLRLFPALTSLKPSTEPG